MAFNINKFSPIGGQSTRGASPQMFSYNSGADIRSDVETSGYFNGAKTYLEVNDIIIVLLNNSRHLYEVTLVPLNGDVIITDNIDSNIAQYYMSNNSTETVISNINEFVKVAGTTVAGDLVSGFDVSSINNRAIYLGKLTNYYKATCVLSLTDGSNKTHTIALSKNGTTINSSIKEITTGSAGRAQSIYTQAFLELSTNDYIEVQVANNTDISNITVDYLDITFERIR